MNYDNLTRSFHSERKIDVGKSSKPTFDACVPLPLWGIDAEEAPPMFDTVGRDFVKINSW